MSIVGITCMQLCCQGSQQSFRHPPIQSEPQQKHRRKIALQPSCPPKLWSTWAKSGFILKDIGWWLAFVICVHGPKTQVNQLERVELLGYHLLTREEPSPLLKASSRSIKSVTLDILLSIPSWNFCSVSTSLVVVSHTYSHPILNHQVVECFG